MAKKKTPPPSLMESIRRWLKKRFNGFKDVKITLSLFGNTISFPLNQSTFLVLIIFPIIGYLIWLNLNTKPCVYTAEAKTDAEAIQWLIEHEAQAVTTEDMDLIKAIFAKDAIIVDAASYGGAPQKWNNPIDRYQPLFKDYDFSDAENTNIRAKNPINGDTVVYISGSHGSYTVNGQPDHYDHPIGTSRWTVRKIDGCWKITKFEFNVSR
jgi:hypothetical protein